MGRWRVRVTQSRDQMVTIVPYSSEIQQPMRATAVLGCHPHTYWAAPFDREQDRAASLHPEGLTTLAALAALGCLDRPDCAASSVAPGCRAYQPVAYLSRPADWSSSGDIATR